MSKPNIVYFVADQMRSDSLHHLGCEASITPNLDGLVEEGVSFENAYCQNPVCVPSRCSFMSGLYCHTTGHRTIHYLQNEDEPNILKEMKNQGYEVIWVGRNDMVPADRDKREYCDAYFDGTHINKVDYVSNNHPTLHPTQDSDEVEPHREPGYYAHFVGKISEEEAHKVHPVKGGGDWDCLADALRYLEEKEKRGDDKPFFLYCTLAFPHPPYGCEDPWFSMIDRSKCEPRRPRACDLDKPSMLKAIATRQNLKDWGDENFIEMRATYLAMVSRFDYQFGLLRDKLKACGFYDNTSIFVFSDHGDYTGDYDIAEKVQNCFEDCITNIPLLVKPAKQFKVEPRISKALVELTDLSATVEEMTGIKTSYVHFGKSLIAALAGSEIHKDAVFCEGGRIHGEYWAMERGHNADSLYWPRLSAQGSEGPEHTKAAMIRMGDMKYVMRLYEKDELYDLKKDPKELVNLIDDEQYESLVNKMKLRLLEWYMETGDIVPNRKDPRW
ncbi:MAG: sulfatase-like hydrolase/transferase [Erysipelotrichaceae bacterium]|nr:sulfatase-like hydrolase/transferase [Erysipelotrichaceae bacterium]